jgi:hypothetical protein
VIGFLVVGINPRRPYDDDYQAFISLLDRQLTTSLASVTLFEEEIRRGETTEVERSRLSEELAVQRSRLQRIAEASPVGMFSISNTGVCSFRIDVFPFLPNSPILKPFRTSTMSPNLRNTPQLSLPLWKRC